jgi:hypothetical protein
MHHLVTQSNVQMLVQPTDPFTQPAKHESTHMTVCMLSTGLAETD